MSKKIHVVDLTEQERTFLALSPESLRSVEELVLFLLQQGPFALGPRYPTVENQASSLGRRSGNLSLIEAEVSFTVFGEDW